MKSLKTRGQSLAEFALIIPLLLVLAMGTFDLGRAVINSSTLQNAAREGARFGAVNHCNTAGIENKVKNKAGGMKGLTINTNFVYAGSTPEFIVVTVNYKFETITPLIDNFIGVNGKITLNGQARNLIESPSICP